MHMMAQSADEEIFKPVSRETSEEFGAGEIPPDVTECSTIDEISESTNFKTSGLINDLKSSDLINDFKTFDLNNDLKTCDLKSDLKTSDLNDDLKTSDINNDLKTSQSVRQKVPSSKWVNFTRVLRLGLAANTYPGMTEMTSSYTEQITTHSKRGSLGKFFRHGFREKAPIVENSYENNAAALQEDSLQQNKGGSLGKMFRQLKSRNSDTNKTNEPVNDSVSEDTGEMRKHRLGKMLRQKLSSEKRRPGSEEILPNTEPIYSGDDVVPNPEQRMRSLGKMFRLKQSTYVSKESSLSSSPSSSKLTGTEK